MAGDSEPSSFRAGIANLRETAKWMVSGALGAAALIAGSSTFSQLGALEFGSLRFLVAWVGLLLATLLCWIPFSRAVAVLHSEIASLAAFMAATRGELEQAVTKVEKQVGSTLPGNKTLRGFYAGYAAARQQAWNSAHDRASREKAVAALDDVFAMCREACISSLVEVRFRRLVNAIGFPGALILVAFLAFTWAANPPKDAKVIDHPYVATLTPAQLSSLRALNVAAACYASGAQLVAVATTDGGPQTAVLVPPPATKPSDCTAKKLTLSGGSIVKVD